MIDTHTHLYFADDFPDGGDEAVRRAIEAGVSHMVFPNVSLDSMEPLLALHRRHPDVTSVAAGIHPEDVDKDWRAKTDDIFARFEGENPVAVGEVGIDLYHDKTFRFEQMDAFGYQLDKAITLGLPVIIHSREALDDTLHVLGLMGARIPGLIFHSFTAGPDEISRILQIPDALVGINGVVTFKNAPELRKAVALAGIDRLVLETDAPYLSPVPKRGRTNESCNIPYIRDKVAEVCGVTPEEAERVTDLNARRIFRLSPPSTA
ncbi:MAG: TatD family hydrolase [Muribaculaceae bacterium]|nr:TatD family hydrolase [Muribaculaceae bacterium]